MFTPSIVLLMIMNTVAATGAVFVAFQARGLEAFRVGGIGEVGFPRQEGRIRGAA